MKPEEGALAECQIERLLADDQGFFKRLVEGMRCGLITVDHRGRVLMINELAREILELKEPLPAEVPVHVALSTHPRLARVLLDALQMSHLPNRAELELRTRERDGKTIGFTISPIRSEAGQIGGVALFFKDLTLVERQEEQERLRDRLVALGQMGANLAHEIRNPLASIEVTVGLLRRRFKGCHEELRLIDKIAPEVSRLNRTVTRSLEFARPLAPERATHDPRLLLEEALEEAENRFGAHEVLVERQYAEETPPIAADGQLLRQVLVNLMFNALEAMEGRGRLLLSARAISRLDRGEPGVELSVADSGPGIPSELRDKLFQPFVTTKKSGSGIGLAMARKIIECHDGMIDVMDGEDGGTVFRVRIPCLPDASEVD
ncbi:MAG: PAS domain-containing protein [Acidobacteriota bacterium]|nr:MAG: PAS domain-containing protein [Acidobacteriota bacterium]